MKPFQSARKLATQFLALVNFTARQSAAAIGSGTIAESHG